MVWCVQRRQSAHRSVPQGAQRACTEPSGVMDPLSLCVMPFVAEEYNETAWPAVRGPLHKAGLLGPGTQLRSLAMLCLQCRRAEAQDEWIYCKCKKLHPWSLQILPSCSSSHELVLEHYLPPPFADTLNPEPQALPLAPESSKRSDYDSIAKQTRS